MRQVQINYKSGKVLKLNYTDHVEVKEKNDKITYINVEGSISGHHPLFWNFEDIESVAVISVGWQRVAEWILRLPVRLWWEIRRKL